ncbi:uncharacterized protein LOC110902684 [Helianthus annuus]|uniref:uncharacterized protein LOC110902684 n=1 Tax=Helianthus annuus TaxID=4232 RepID=UPI000B8EE8F6|nr:uncharacterized protein LOC110902684 [Helianthus annuus]
MKNLNFVQTDPKKYMGGGGTWRRCMIFTGRTSLIVLMTLRCGLVCRQEVTRVFGVGSSDLYYMVSGTSSSSSGCAPSSVEYQRSIEEAQEMRTQLAKLEARLETETKEREDLRVRLESERKAREDLQQHINETMKRELQDFMKNWRPPRN